MIKRATCLFCVLFEWLLAGSINSRAADPPAVPAVVPLVPAHAHNDYEHNRPLFDALDRGFCSVEADIHLVKGELLVAHDRSQAKPGQDLQRLYLDPLRERIRANGGRVYPKGPSLTLLIDVKSDADSTYVALREVLRSYADMLTIFRGGTVVTNAITVVISGNRARNILAAEPERLAALDGRLEDLGGKAPTALIPLISDSWMSHFKWRGTGPFTIEERNQLHELVKKAHAEGRRIRFWATPDTPACWKELTAARVDLLSVDDLDGLQKFLLNRNQPNQAQD